MSFTGKQREVQGSSAERVRDGSGGTAITDFSSQAHRRHDRAVIVIAFDSAVSIKYIYVLTALSVSYETTAELRNL